MADSACAIIILAGGASTRMGYDKRQLRLWGADGPMLLHHVLGVVQPHFQEHLVVLNDPAAWPDLPARVISDPIQGAGPLAGLVAGLAAMQAERAVVLACDMPLVQGALLNALASYPTEAAAVVPLTAASSRAGEPILLPEPLLARYQRHCLPIVQACLDQGLRRMTDLLERLEVQYMPPYEWQRYDPEGRSFLNLNRPIDLQDSGYIKGTA